MTIETQMFWQDFIVPSALCDILFGHNFDKVQSNVVQQTRNVLILHIFSMSYVKEIFTIAGIFAVETKKEDKFLYYCCGKVQILNLYMDMELTGYVISKTQILFVIKLNYL